jgi:hypothetical protein
VKILGKLSVKDGRLVWELEKDAQRLESSNEAGCQTTKEDLK